MPIKLRKSKIKNGYSFYFDVSHKGKRWTEWPSIKIQGDPKLQENKDKIELAKKMRIERERELTILGKGLPGELKQREQDFFDVYDELCEPRMVHAKHIYDSIRKKIKKFVGEKYLPISGIDKPWLARYLTFLKKEGLVNNTVHHYFGFMGTILKEAMCKGYIVQNPYDLFSRHERPKQKRRKADFLSQDELAEFMNCETKGVDETLKQMFFFSCFTGLRWSDCQRIKWGNIRMVELEGKKQEVIILIQKKTGDQVVVPITPSAQCLLEEMKEASRKPPLKTDHLFTRWSSEYEKTKRNPLHSSMSRHLKKWRDQVGFMRRFKFHLARHTYATWLIQSGVDLYTVSKLLGHADMSATTIYAHVSEQVKIQAAGKLPFVSFKKKPKHLTIAA